VCDWKRRKKQHRARPLFSSQLRARLGFFYSIALTLQGQTPLDWGDLIPRALDRGKTRPDARRVDTHRLRANLRRAAMIGGADGPSRVAARLRLATQPSARGGAKTQRVYYMR
jgi:hypothetical protein